ncbi:hypothetical protein C8R46DRAFT_1358710 [Mycena filopes]|nr:hypothetical protein C8R46DRAFT_1358710 [Mycena filopes]
MNRHRRMPSGGSGRTQDLHGRSLLSRIWRTFGSDSQSSESRRQTLVNDDTKVPNPTVVPLTAPDDSAAKFWSVYISEAERYDSALVESWRADMEGMLIFSGLFSASLTAFIIESYKNLVPATGDMTVVLLNQLSLQLSAQFNGSQFSQPPPIPFQVPTSSLVCNGLWFVSLGLTLSCALLATLVEQWAREFIHKTEIRPSPVRRARVFSFLYYGVSRFGIHAIVDIIPLLLHLGLVLFFAGLAAFLLPINAVMTAIVSSVLVVFVTFYAVITILPVVSLDCPYRTPLSGPFWRAVQHLAALLHLPSTSRSLTEAVLNAAMQRRDIRDERAVLWTLEALTDNTELLPFVEAAHDIIHGPTGFRRVDDHLFRLVLKTADPHTSLPQRIVSLLWSTDTLPPTDPLRERRTLAGLRALWALGIVAARVTRAPASAVYAIDLESMDALALPTPYRLSLRAVTAYVQLKGIEARFADIGALLSLGGDHFLSAPRERRRVARVLRGVLPGLLRDCGQRRLAAPEAFALLRQLAEDEPGEHAARTLARGVVRQLDEAPVFDWAVQHFGVAARLLRVAFEEGVAPYKLLATCEEIVPDPVGLARRARGEGVVPKFHIPPHIHLGPLRAFIKVPTLNDLDTIIHCAVRLLPLMVTSGDLVQTIHWYAANRARCPTALGYAFAECDWPSLGKAILDDLVARPTLPDATLHGLATLCLWREDFVRVLDCERALTVLATLQSTDVAAHYTVTTILSAAALSKLEPKLQTASDDLALSHHHNSSEALPIADRYASLLTQLLAACCAPDAAPPHKAAPTAEYLALNWRPWMIQATSPARQREFAEVLARLVKRATPGSEGAGLVVQAIADRVRDKIVSGGGFADAESVSVIRQALARYQMELVRFYGTE